MADGPDKDIEEMMKVLAQMDEKAKNMEKLVVQGDLGKKVKCAKPPEKSGTQPKILGISGFRTQIHFK